MRQVEKECWEWLQFLRSRLTQGCIAAHLGVALGRVWHIEMMKCKGVRAREYFAIKELHKNEMNSLSEEVENGYEEEPFGTHGRTRKSYKFKKAAF
jgi:hypothetical protein